MEGESTILNVLLDNPGLWPCVLRLILEKLPNADANNFSMACQDAREAVKIFRPEIRLLKQLIKNGCGFRALPYRMHCSGGMRATCKRIANISLLYGNQWDAKEIIVAHQAFRQYGLLEARCLYAWYCLNIDDPQKYIFLNMDGPFGFRGLRVRWFFRTYFCQIHRWIIAGEWNKFSNAMTFFTDNEKRYMFERRTEHCWHCGSRREEGSYYFAKAQVDRRFRDYIGKILQSPLPQVTYPVLPM